MILDEYQRLVPPERGLAAVVTRRQDGSAQATVVNTGVLAHPIDGMPVVGFVALGGARKVENLRRDPAITVTIRTGWDWATVEGVAELFGPDDPYGGFDPVGLPGLLRDVFTACAATHDDWDEYDRVMAEQRRLAVLVRPIRVYGNRV